MAMKEEGDLWWDLVEKKRWYMPKEKRADEENM